MNTLSTFWWYYPAQSRAVQKLVAGAILVNIAWASIWTGSTPWMALVYIWMGVLCHTASKHLKPTSQWRLGIEQSLQHSNGFAQIVINILFELANMTLWFFMLPRYILKLKRKSSQTVANNAPSKKHGKK